MPATLFIENVNQLQQLESSGIEMRSHFGDLVAQAGEVFEVLGIGAAAGGGEVVWELSGCGVWHKFRVSESSARVNGSAS